MNTSPSIHHLGDTDVQDAVATAARLACRSLDELFPGWDNPARPGITSNFQGQLEEVIGRMLTGESQVRQGSLPSLVMTDHAFGNPLASGEMFVVIREIGEGFLDSPQGESFTALLARGERPESGKHYAVLGDAGSFVEPKAQLASGLFEPKVEDAIDPFTSFDAAVQGAMRWLRAHGMSNDAARLSIVPVAFVKDSCSALQLNPAATTVTA